MSRQTPETENALGNVFESGQFISLPQTAPSTEQMTFSSDRPQSTIDWILFPTNWTIKIYRAIDLELSDHRPVLATWKYVPTLKTDARYNLRSE